MARSLSSVACVAVLMLGGCEVNDFINPAEPNILARHKSPLVVPILDTLASGIEEPSSAYSGATDIRAEDLVPAIQDYQIGKSDLLNVSIFDLLGEGTGETVKQVRVTESGFISLPYIPPVKAESLTEQQVQDVIIKAYSDAKLIRQARVSVTVVEARARTFSVMGNVGVPGEYQITRPDFRMLDAMVAARAPQNAIGVKYAYVLRKITKVATTEPSPMNAPAMQPTTAPGDLLTPQSRANTTATVLNAAMLLDDTAGGGMAAPTTMPATAPSDLLMPTTNEAPTGMVEGKAAPAPAASPSPMPALPATGSEPNGIFQFNDLQAPGDVRIIRVPIDQLRQYGELKYNIVIRPMDMIIVPEPQQGIYYMGGHVLAQGAYSLSGNAITLKQAWVTAHGGDDFAVPGRTEVIRRIGTNKEVFVRVDMSRVLGGEQPDIFLKPDDTIIVGTDFFAPFISALRSSFRVSSGFGFLYDRNFYAGPNGF
ncbi:MAG: polysaccharide biosynthesis/export family protein [Planctomycetota bacterium]|nr:polysaccharide biosynthesis/export family protein [Planctomycetota bacterium]